MPTYPIVGARYCPPAQEVLDNLPAGTKLLLRRQPDNPYDGNAIQVLLEFAGASGTVYELLRDSECELPFHLGFIPRESAAKLAPLMDQHDAITSGENSTSSYAEWPATLTFAAHGGPIVTFEEIKT